MQQQWLPSITAFKLFHMCTFGEFLNRCFKSSKAKVTTKVLDDVRATDPSLGLTKHESYDPETILQVDNDLMN